ncbi:type II toxin-antitoxin system VapC family toxin [Nitriliruptoraceae bacterium ZYF776]|nr:type II toxin-antitoxin system VapC family toxin [Profundirhabdus halotolerans]
MIVLDTSVLIYAVGADHQLRAPSTDLIDAIGRGELPATTTVEVIQEFTHVRARRRDREDAAGLAAQYLTLLTPLITVTADDLRAGLDRFRRSSTIGCFDAVLVAAAQRIGAPLVTADRVLLDEHEGAVPLAEAPARFLGR